MRHREKSIPSECQPEPRATRRLFLDDDPARAEAFLAEYPDAVWVSTASACIACLDESWDEVHLDHDLGGEIYVDIGRDDCGMAIVRWLAYAPRLHLRSARFFVHSHNAPAAYVMLLQMKSLGLNVRAQPFGSGGWKRPVAPTSSGRWAFFRKLFSLFRRSSAERKE